MIILGAAEFFSNKCINMHRVSTNNLKKVSCKDKEITYYWLFQNKQLSAHKFVEPGLGVYCYLCYDRVDLVYIMEILVYEFCLSGVFIRFIGCFNSSCHSLVSFSPLQEGVLSQCYFSPTVK